MDYCDAAALATGDGAKALRWATSALNAWTNAPEDADFYGVTMRDPEGNEFCVT